MGARTARSVLTRNSTTILAAHVESLDHTHDGFRNFGLFWRRHERCDRVDCALSKSRRHHARDHALQHIRRRIRDLRSSFVLSEGHDSRHGCRSRRGQRASRDSRRKRRAIFRRARQRRALDDSGARSSQNPRHLQSEVCTERCEPHLSWPRHFRTGGRASCQGSKARAIRQADP